MKVFKFLWPLVATAGLAGCGGAGNTVTAGAVPAADSDSAMTISLNPTFRCQQANTLQQEMLSLINQARTQARSCGGQLFDAASPVRWNSQLAQAAAVHSDDMAINNFFAHVGTNGFQVADRATAAGYNWWTIGENIHAGSQTTAGAVEGWLASADHCRNIMNPNFEEMGGACAQNSASQYGTYYTQVLGAHQ